MSAAPAPHAREFADVHRGTGLRARRLSIAAFAVAVCIALIAALRDVGGPWDSGMRGCCGAQYSDGAVAHTLHYGLGVTLGMPTFVVEDGNELVRSVNWHHPPLYWLYLSFAAWLFGHENVVLRLAHLVLYMPGIFALYWLLKTRFGEFTAAVATLLYASAPLVAYFGPMVLQDGAVLGLGLVTLWRFQAWVDAPSRRSWLAVAGCFLLVTSLDYPGYWWGPAMFVLALGTEHRRRALLGVLSLFFVAVLSFCVMAVHYGIEFGGPLGFVTALLDTLGGQAPVASKVDAARVQTSAAELFVANGNGPIVALAVGGLVLGLASSRHWRYRALLVHGTALALPGVLNCASMLRHALDHVFWSIHGFAGLATLGAIVPVVAVRLLRSNWRVAASGLLLWTAATVAFGIYQTHELIARHAVAENGTTALVQKALPHLGTCAWALTSAPRAPKMYFGRLKVWYDVDTAEKLGAVLALGHAYRVRGELGFVLAPAHRGSALHTELDKLAAPNVVDDLLVYRVKR